MKLRVLVGALCLMYVNLLQAAEAPPEVRKVGEYTFTADSIVQPKVKSGRLEGPFEFHSSVFANTVRRYWIYIPVGYKAKKPPNLLVFQDGHRAINPKGSLRVPIVLDNLIAKREIPLTLGIFVTPGNASEHYPDSLGFGNPDRRMQEYDMMNDHYARFLKDELLPEIAKKYSFSADPKRRVIGGASSGAAAAFIAAWLKPEIFGNVISIIGSYTSLGYVPATANEPMQPGADLLPGLIRKAPIRPLRIFLQDGSNDVNNEHGNWWLANQQMLSALEWANADADSKKTAGPRYDINHVWGDGFHQDLHGGTLLPDILRWIFRDQK